MKTYASVNVCQHQGPITNFRQQLNEEALEFL